MQKKLTRKEQAQITKRNLYDAAIALIERKGFENVSIEDITTAANTAKGTFYLYFKSKQDLIYHTIALYDEIAERAYEGVKELETFQEQLQTYLMLLNQDVAKIGDNILNALMVQNLLEEKKFITVETRAIYRALRKIIQRGFDTGELSQAHHMDEYLEMIIIFIQGLDYYWCNVAKEFDYVFATRREAEIFAKGLVAIYRKRD